jgi:hypothetical protein
MDKNIIRDVEKQNNPIGLETEETKARLDFTKLNPPASWPLNIIVPINNHKRVSYVLIHFSPSFLNCLCTFANKTYAVVSSSLFFISLDKGLKTFSTFFHCKCLALACLGKPWQSLGSPCLALACLSKPWHASASLGMPQQALACLGSPCLALTWLGKPWQSLGSPCLGLTWLGKPWQSLGSP